MAKSKSSKSAAAKQPAATPVQRENKTDKVIALLRRDGGATLAEITEGTGWLPHSARAVLTGFRKKGYTLERAKVEGVTRWSIAAEPSA